MKGGAALKPFIFAAFLFAAPWSLLQSAQAPENSWNNLSQLHPGERIEIVDARMKSHRGDLAAYTTKGISLSRNGGVITIVRAEVASIKRIGQSRRRRNILFGAAIGAAVGLAVGAVRGKTYHEEGETTVFMAVWTPIGAGIGAATGAVLPPRSPVTIYRATSIRR